jgi:hypothetical protein
MNTVLPLPNGSLLRQALQAQRTVNLETCADSQLWAELTFRNAKQALARHGEERFDAVMARFSEEWFEERTWRTQAEAFGRLYDADPDRPVAELVQAFGVPDVGA